MKRRQLLTTTGCTLTALVSGCVSTDEGVGEPGTTPTDDVETPTPDDPESHTIGDTASTGFGEVTVSELSVQKSVVDRGAFRILHWAPGVQYALIEAGSEPPDFIPVFDDEPVEPAKQVTPTGPDTTYILGCDVEHAATAETAAIALEHNPRIRWELPASALVRLANRPDISVLDANVVDRDGASALQLELENTGDRDGIFRAIVISPVGADIDADISIEVPQGRTITKTVQNSVIEDWGLEYELGEVDPDRRTFGEGG